MRYAICIRCARISLSVSRRIRYKDIYTFSYPPNILPNFFEKFFWHALTFTHLVHQSIFRTTNISSPLCKSSVRNASTDGPVVMVVVVAYIQHTNGACAAGKCLCVFRSISQAQSTETVHPFVRTPHCRNTKHSNI